MTVHSLKDIPLGIKTREESRRGLFGQRNLVKEPEKDRLEKGIATGKTVLLV
jgi:hypothetical protein